MTLRAIILGAAAGGGLPQWNCGCENCNLARRGDIPPQTQSSLTVSPDGLNWAVLNASPDIRSQLSNTPALFPTGLRQMPVQSVLVTNGDIDHVAGLLTLREMQPFSLFATQSIQDVIAQNPIFDALNAEVVTRSSISLDTPFELVPDLQATLFPVPGKVPLYLEDEHVQTDLIGEQTVGVALTSQGRTAYYIPGCAALTPELKAQLDGADLLFFDGTLWRDDEMVRAGLGQKTGKRMGHMSMDGPDGSITSFADMQIGRKIYVHMNNTNPALRPDSVERAQAEASGWTIGQDGMEITL
ncbi:pyrroloquinoline quinone biosynthesis protein PqqB [Rhodobacteraceae bacterium B1Z28]|uniref:Coenzyme PQQ synthesis protein B n=1 Tax=Ruegeria haliotis TaxID=2747601 RepID=A0ABX2PUM3_9RHOB|nr:pyrroloquinoline quinone biosynthesis protein PqqB [Ruegeria haliotis]NVO56719.1 pyrroloquinoline quinone biosynthesis protein PqqB [Ruegeria haliotis]